MGIFWRLSAILVALWAGPALAQVAGSGQAFNYYYSGTGAVTAPPSWLPVSASNPLPVTGTFSASLGGFVPSGSYATLTATASSSASTALPTNTGTVAFQNQTAVAVSCTLASGSATATTNEIIVPAGSTLFVGTTGYSNAACINQTGSASNVIVLAGGSGLGTGFGGGSSGSSSGGAVYGPTAGGSAAANPPVQIGGVQTNSNTGLVQPWVINSSGNGLIDAPAGSALLAAVNAAVPCLNATASNTNSYSNAGTNPTNCDLNGNLYVNGSGHTQPVSGTVSSAANVTLTDCSGTVATGGTAVNAFTAQTTLHGFTIVNTNTTEVMWISFTTTAAASTAGSYPIPSPAATTFAGGGSYTSPPGMGTNHALSVVAATTGHTFSCTWW